MRTVNRIPAGGTSIRSKPLRACGRRRAILRNLPSACSDSLDGDAGAVLSKSTALEMLAPVKGGFGLGFQVAKSRSSATFGHGGANVGFQSLFVMHRGGEGVAIMTDSDNGIALIAEILASVGAAYGWSDYTPKVEEAVSARARSPDAFCRRLRFREASIFSIDRRGPSLFLADSAGVHQPLSRVTDEVLHARSRSRSHVRDGRSGMVTGVNSGTPRHHPKSFRRSRPSSRSVPPCWRVTPARISWKLDVPHQVEGDRVFSKLDDQDAIEIFPSAKDQLLREGCERIADVFARYERRGKRADAAPKRKRFDLYEGASKSDAMMI